MILSDAERALLSARAERYASVTVEEKAVHCTVVSFTRGKGRYALPLTDLREIRALSSYCPMPGASAIVPGVAYYRGELLSLHDLAVFVSGAAPATEPSWMLVTEHAGERLGLLADALHDVIPLELSEIHTLPLTMAESSEVFMGMTESGVLVAEASRMLQVAKFVYAY
jgi:chemotaxis signal transduction protein